MRTTLLALALVLVACGRPDRDGTPPAADAAPGISTTDQLALRFPRDGGRARAFAYPALDTVVWTSSANVPGLARVLAFDEEAGSLVAVGRDGAPVRVELRRGTVSREGRSALTRVASDDGEAIYGLAKGGKVARLTPGAPTPWTYEPPSPATELFPQPDGSLLVLSEREGRTRIWHLHPPETKVMHTAELPGVKGAPRVLAGDRLYFAVDTALIGVRGHDLSAVPSVRLRHAGRSIVTTPSGDRIYVAVDSTDQIVVVDRYSEDVAERIQLPGAARELRMDPTGRYLLARPARGDSVWVIAVGTERLIGAVPTAWRSDLPAVAPDGAIALLRGKDVVLADGETLVPQRRVEGGASDLWHFLTWNGFRRGTIEEEPPLPVAEEEAPADTTNPFAGQVAGEADAALAPLDSAASAPPPPSTAPAPPARRDTARAAGFTVQFAALRDEKAARDLAQRVRSGPGGARLTGSARVQVSVVAGSTIYRVVAGPFPSREEAERAASASGQSYWVYEGLPE